MTFDEWHEKAPIYSVTGAHEAAQMAWDHQQKEIDSLKRNLRLLEAYYIFLQKLAHGESK